MQTTKRHIGHHEGTTFDRVYFKRNNNLIKYGFWVIISVLLLAFLIRRLILRFHNFSFHAAHNSLAYHALAGDNPTTVQWKKSSIARINRRAINAYKRLIYPRPAISQRWQHVFDIPSCGECIFLLLYFALLSAGLWTQVIFKSTVEGYGIQWEVVGFRAAWIGTMQLPLLYATSCKHNIITLCTGIPVIRLNWLHRWIARTTFLALLIHWIFFFQEWVLAKMAWEMLQRRMVIYGFAAWLSIGSMLVTGFRWFRNMFFEIWIISHITLAWAVLGLSYSHTGCTKYFVFTSLAFLAYDLAARSVLALHHNFGVRSRSGPLFGYGNRLVAKVLDDDYLQLTIYTSNSVNYAGRFVYLTIPAVKPFQSHPFTVASCADSDGGGRELTIIIKKHSGFTKKLYNWASETRSSTLCFLQGPHGSPPSLRNTDAVVFVSTGNRTSYCVGLLQEICHKPRSPKRVVVHVIVPNANTFEWYQKSFSLSEKLLSARGSTLEIHVHVTSTSNMVGQSLQDWQLFGISIEKYQHRNSIEETHGLLAENQEADKLDPRKQEKATSINCGPTIAPLPRFEKYSLDLEEGERSSSDSDLSLDDLVEKIDESTIEPEVSYGRPDIQRLVDNTVESIKTDQNITVVAAVPSSLAAIISSRVCKHIGQRSSGNAGTISLWIERNG